MSWKFSTVGTPNSTELESVTSKMYLLDAPSESVDIPDPPTNTHSSQFRPLWVSLLDSRNHIDQLLLSLRMEGPCKMASGQA